MPGEQSHPLAKFLGGKLVSFGWIEAKLRRNLGNLIRLGKIKILHPQKTFDLLRL